MKKIASLFTALCLLFVCFAQAEMVDTYAFKNQADRTRAVALAKSLRCPQCQNQNLVESNSPIAYDLRIEVYDMVNEGKTNDEIIETMTARFGHFVNYKPPFQWNTLLLWGLPVALFVVAFWLIWRSRQSQHPSIAPPLVEESLHNHPQAKSDLKNSSRNYSVIWVFLLLCIIPLGYYASLDRFERVQAGEKEMIEKRNQQIEMSEVHKTEDLIAKKQDQLRQDPNNAQLWIQLGEAYMQQDQFDNALIAYSNAEKIEGSRPAILGLAATAMYYQAGQHITPQVERLLNEALTQDKNEVSSITLLAGEAFKNKEYAKAENYWQQLLDSGSSAVDRRSVIQHIKMIDYLTRGQTP